jgi:N-acetylglucosamine-6-phosphate deacetylase
MILSAGTVLAADRDLVPGYVVIKQGRIIRVAGGPPPADPDEPDLISFPDGTLIPGLIDLQVNGGAGVDCSRTGPEGYDALGRYLAATGVTAYLPTIVTGPLEEMRRALDVVAAAMTRRASGPRAAATPVILGAHMEGPYLNPLRRGAHLSQYLRHPSADEFAETLRAGRATLRMVTLAPELEGAEPVVKRLVAEGVVVGLGHTDAGYDDLNAAAQWGGRVVTHVFNAMRGFHHREPGAAGAALLNSALTVGVIADLIHLHPATLALIAKTAGPGRVLLVTDAVAAAGMERGTYSLGLQTVELKGGAPRLADGTLAGSMLQLAGAVRNFASAGGVSLRDAVQSASRIPARLLGLGRKGRIARGCDADLVVLDRSGSVTLTLVGGELAYRRTTGGVIPSPEGRHSERFSRSP